MARVKPHFKLHVSATRHPKTAAAFTDNDLLAAYVRIGCMAVERFADRTNDSFTVTRRELPALMGTKRSDSAEKLLNYLVDTSPILAKYSDTTVLITLPNFAKKQGFDLKNCQRTADPATATATATAKPLIVPPSERVELPLDDIGPEVKPTLMAKTKREPPTPDGIALATLLRSELAEHVPRARQPTNLDSWARTFDRMLRGTREVAPIPRTEIEAVVRWVVRDEFWRANVQSAGKLREKYSQLHAKATMAAPISAGDRRAKSDREAARAVLAGAMAKTRLGVKK